MIPIIALVAVAARAESDALTAARSAYRSLDYERALPLLEEALRDAGTREEQIDVYALRARVFVALDDMPGARAAFAQVLRRDPDFRLDPATTSPKIIGALEAARVEAETMPASTDVSATDPSLTVGASSEPIWHSAWFWGVLGVICPTGVVGFD